MQLNEYRKLFEQNQSAKVSGLCGRIIRGTKPGDFVTLTDDPTRKLVMLMGPDGLEKIMGKIDYEALVDIGYEPDYIVRKVVDEGNQFKLVVFSEGGEAKVATWDNVAAVVAEVYPDVAAKLYQNLDALKRLSFADIESSVGFDFSEVDKVGANDDRFMTYERFRDGDDDVVAARAFLYFSVHLRELFSGDGYTYDANGNRGLMEYIVPNRPLDALGDNEVNAEGREDALGYEVIDMSVVVPTQLQNIKNGRPSRKATATKGGKNMNVQLLIIDPQNDFMDMADSALPVPGAVADMQRVAALIDRVGEKLTDIHVTLDSHRLIDIAHPAWWMDQDGNSPAPFTIISVDDVENDIWTPRNPAFRQKTLDYVKQLEVGGKYPLCVWPPHCLIGGWGHNVQVDLNDALQRWSEKEFAMVDYVTKGSNPWTEHYGALMAEVPDPSDPGTALNTDFLQILAEADIVVVAGEALSHCVKETVQQIADNFDDEQVKKFQILTDCSSPVPAVPGGPNFPQIAQDWLREMEKRGMKLTTSVEFLA